MAHVMTVGNLSPFLAPLCNPFYHWPTLPLPIADNLQEASVKGGCSSEGDGQSTSGSSTAQGQVTAQPEVTHVSPGFDKLPPAAKMKSLPLNSAVSTVTALKRGGGKGPGMARAGEHVQTNQTGQIKEADMAGTC